MDEHIVLESGSTIHFSNNTIYTGDTLICALNSTNGVLEWSHDINGTLDVISVKKGELAMPGAQIIQMVNINNFYVNADVSEKFIAAVKKGNPVTVSFPTYPDWKIDTKVYRTGNIIKQENRTFTLQAKINNKDKSCNYSDNNQSFSYEN